MNNQLAIVEPTEVMELTPSEQIKRATEQAVVLADIIKRQKLAVRISNRDYVKVEGWVPLANFNGVIPREVSNEPKDDGRYVARVQLVKVSDGTVLTEASAECGGPDEKMWQGRVPNARRSMAATRATGKACRLAFSWIMVLAGYEATPAEEMDSVSGAHENTQKAAETFDAEVSEWPTFSDEEPAELSSHKGTTYLWIRLGKTFTEEWAKVHGFRDSKKAGSMFQTATLEAAKACRDKIDGK